MKIIGIQNTAVEIKSINMIRTVGWIRLRMNLGIGGYDYKEIRRQYSKLKKEERNRKAKMSPKITAITINIKELSPQIKRKGL